MDITFSNTDITEFKIARTFGQCAFDELNSTYNLLKTHDDLTTKTKEESFDDKYANGGVNDSRLELVKEEAFQYLSKAVILYQSSMESIIALAESHNPDLEKKIKKIKGFKKRWEFILNYFGESQIEFNEYESKLYQELRIPLTHLSPNKEERLNQIKNMSFEKVYIGMRYGWWSYMRVLKGLNLHDNSWERICSNGLEPSLFMDKHPDKL